MRYKNFYMYSLLSSLGAQFSRLIGFLHINQSSVHFTQGHPFNQKDRVPYSELSPFFQTSNEAKRCEYMKVTDRLYKRVLKGTDFYVAANRGRNGYIVVLPEQHPLFNLDMYHNEVIHIPFFKVSDIERPVVYSLPEYVKDNHPGAVETYEI